jgi:hypothetical protein
MKIQINVERTSDLKPLVELIKRLNNVPVVIEINFSNTDVWSYL